MWYSVLNTAYEDISASRCLSDTFRARRLVHDEHIKSFIQRERCVAKAVFFATTPLIDHAVIMFCQLFVSGRSGPGFASNNQDDVKSIRAKMEQYAMGALKWNEQKYKEFKERILTARNKFVGHYDGETADFHYTSPGVSVRAVPTASLNEKEIEELRLVVMAMILYFRQELLPKLVWPGAVRSDERDASRQ